MSEIPLGLYLWRRIRQIGIESIFGVPGDFNLNFLDFIYEVEGLKWVGNANELNSAYAADGYGRTRGVPGCLVTTHGVGELSAINGIAGSMSEHVPVIHIVGQTPRMNQDNHLMIHHSIGTTPDHQVYNKTSEHVRCTAAELWDPKKAPAEIDRVLRECWVRKLPVYIFFPVDLTGEMVPAIALDKPLDLSMPANEKGEQEVIEAIGGALKKAANPVLFLDFLSRAHAHSESRDLANALPLPIYASHMSKGAGDETDEKFIGLYNGMASKPGVAESMEASDLVLAVGWWPSDSNTAAFSRKIAPEKRVDIMDTFVIIKGKRFDNVYMARVLDQLAATAKKLGLPAYKRPSVPSQPATNSALINGDTSSSKITQKYIWPRLGHFLQPGDVLMADTGTASYGLPSCPLPSEALFISQTYYGSIGHATPCALGVDLALRELHAADPSKPRRRAVLVTGDGSIQLTIQEVGTMIARGLQPIIIIINNAGYTIERAIHGARATYNDIAPYDYSHLLSLFGRETRTEETPAESGNAGSANARSAKAKPKNFRRAHTPQEFEAAMSEPAIVNPTEVQVLEVFMEKLDIPWQLARLLKNRLPGTEEYYRREGFSYSDEPV